MKWRPRRWKNITIGSSTKGFGEKTVEFCISLFAITLFILMVVMTLTYDIIFIVFVFVFAYPALGAVDNIWLNVPFKFKEWLFWGPNYKVRED